MKAIIFDFDGVILESTQIKTDAFKELFLEYPDKTDKIVDYHIKNLGISRFIKFRYIYEEILGLPFSEEKEEMLSKKFTDLVLDKILAVPFVDGVEDFLNKHRDQCLFFVASGTPQEELNYIVMKRNMNRYFKEVHGTPRNKVEIIKDICQRYGLSNHEVSFIGDGESDMIAANDTRVNFIARMTTENELQFAQCKNKIDNFIGFTHN